MKELFFEFFDRGDKICEKQQTPKRTKQEDAIKIINSKFVKLIIHNSFDYF